MAWGESLSLSFPVIRQVIMDPVPGGCRKNSMKEFPGGPVVQDPVLSLQWLGSLLRHSFDSWQVNFHMPWSRPTPPPPRNSMNLRDCRQGELLSLQGLLVVRSKREARSQIWEPVE